MPKSHIPSSHVPNSTVKRDSPPGAQSLRFRLTAVATIVVAAVLAITAVALVVVQRGQLTANLDASLQQRADVLNADFAVNVSPMLLSTNDEDRAVQLVSLDGVVLAATSNLAGQPPLATPPVTTDEIIESRDDLPLDDDRYRFLSRRIQTAEGPAVLHVAENSDDLEDAIRTLTVALTVTIPTVVAILAAFIWWLTGRTLEPVDRMRAEVDSITTTNSDRRVQVPEHDDEISRLGVTMNRMLDRLADASDRQRRFVADAAHELRTPLTRMRANLDIDLAQPDTADPFGTIHTVREETIELQGLLDDLLHLARSDAGRTPRHREPVDLDDIVMDEIHDLRISHPELTIDASEVSAAHLHANPDQLRRAVRNVFANAARYAEHTATIALGESTSEIVLTVTDDGPGIPKEHRDRIFERFSRLQDARTRHEGGAGLGLAITRDIIENHGGTIYYDTGHHDGAHFVIKIPHGL